MPERTEHVMRDLRCQKNDHPFKAKIRQTVHTVEETGQTTHITTPRGGLQGVSCPECGSPPKDPNE